MTRPALSFIDPSTTQAAQLWRAIERDASPPYFLSWAWTENWLACLPAGSAPRLAALFADGKPVAAFFLGHRRVPGFPPSRALFLNTTGTDRFDELCIEHNAILCAADPPCSLAQLVDALPENWDEIVLPALAGDAFPGSALGVPLARHRISIDREEAAPFVDLARVREAEGGYLALLGSGTRSQIRRAQRAFGEIEIEIAADERHALHIYEELKTLHGQHWRSRGSPGAFADPWFDRFHRRLIENRHRHGEIQLLRVRANGSTVGCLYNLVGNGRVLFYQSGFPDTDDPHKKPGYVCHAEAVRYNGAAGLAVYDFLGGNARYKRNLATDEKRLVWARIRRPLLRFAVEARLRSWKRAVERRSQ